MLVLKIQGKIIMSGGSGACLLCKYRGEDYHTGGGGGQGHACSVNTEEDYNVRGVIGMLVL